MKIGMNIKVDVTKLEKERFFKGEKGTYVDLTAFFDTEKVGEYGDNGTIMQSTSKQEREDGIKMPICGNVRVFYRQNEEQNTKKTETEFEKEDVPF